MTTSKRFGTLVALCLAALVSITATAVSSTSSRPQLTSTQAASYTKATYLAKAGTLGALCSGSCTYSANRFYEYNNSGDGSGN